MRNSVSIIAASLLAILLSCSEGGEIPLEDAKAKYFAELTEIFKEFLKEEGANRNFSSIDEGLNFNPSATGCVAESFLNLSGASYRLESSQCVRSMFTYDRLPVFFQTSFASLNNGNSLYIQIGFLGVVEPPTGTYEAGFVCDDLVPYCYQSVSVVFYVLDKDNEILEQYFLQASSIYVLNQNKSVETTFSGLFYPNWSSVFDGFYGSGKISCCK